MNLLVRGCCSRNCYHSSTLNFLARLRMLAEVLKIVILLGFNSLVGLFKCLEEAFVCLVFHFSADAMNVIEVIANVILKLVCLVKRFGQQQ